MEELKMEENPMMQRILGCVEYLRGQTAFQPQTAVVLGSGLGGFADRMQVEKTVAYSDIPGFPVSTISGHAGKFLFGTVGTVPVVAMQGRVHYYEGYSMQEVVLPIRVMRMLGAKRMFLTNAAGGINPAFQPGDLMLLTGHIAQLVPSPLSGENLNTLGPRFPDLSQVYDPTLRARALQEAAAIGFDLKQGVYLQTTGPQYETPEEIRMFAGWGADAVGMSTACEAIAARHMGVEVCGISCITNMAAGLGAETLNHEEVQETANLAADRFQSLLYALIAGDV